ILALAASSAAQSLARSVPAAASLGVAFGAANGLDDALFYVMAMEASDPRMAASTYALFMAASNASVAGGPLFGASVSAFSGRYTPAFLAASLLTLGALPLVRPLSQPVDKPEPADADLV